MRTRNRILRKYESIIKTKIHDFSHRRKKVLLNGIQKDYPALGKLMYEENEKAI